MNNSRQVSEFLDAIHEAQINIERMKVHLDNLMDIAQADVNWTDACTAQKINADLQEVVDFTFQEGEYAQ